MILDATAVSAGIVVIAIGWPLVGPAVLSDKDAALPTLVDFDSPFDYDGKPMELLTIE